MSSDRVNWKTPKNLLKLSVLVALATIALKTLAWWLTDSVALLSDAMESFVNLASAMFALQMVTVAARPADDGHPYGHHKAEYFSAGFEGILIVGAALGIIISATHRWFNPQPLVQLDIGISLSILSSVLNGVLAYFMFQSAKRYRSAALEGDAKHLLTDVWTSAGVVVGLVRRVRIQHITITHGVEPTGEFLQLRVFLLRRVRGVHPSRDGVLCHHGHQRVVLHGVHHRIERG